MRKVLALFVMTMGPLAVSGSAGTAQTQTNTQVAKTTVAELRARAERGDAKAQYDLGWRYADGQGVPRDDAQAVVWWRKAAEQGHAAAQSNLGMMYSTGQGVPQDYGLAVVQYRLAAEQGDAAAQNNLGMMYSTGQGVPQDYVEAHMWRNLAAARATGEDQKKFADGREALATKMTPANVAEAQRRARAWSEAFERRQKK